MRFGCVEVFYNQVEAKGSMLVLGIDITLCSILFRISYGFVLFVII